MVAVFISLIIVPGWGFLDESVVATALPGASPGEVDPVRRQGHAPTQEIYGRFPMISDQIRYDRKAPVVFCF
jgi:hypothetical protein